LWGMAEEHRERKRMRVEEELVADPEEVLLALAVQGTTRIDAGVGTQKGAVHVLQLERPQELDVCGRHSGLGGGHGRRIDPVTAQGGVTAVVQEHRAVVATSPEVAQQHVFMVPLEKHAPRAALPQAQEPIDHLARGGPAIDVVAEEDDRVGCRGIEMVEEDVDLVEAAVNVADDECAAGTHPSAEASPRFPSTCRRLGSSPMSWSAAEYGSISPRRTCCSNG